MSLLRTFLFLTPGRRPVEEYSSGGLTSHPFLPPAIHTSGGYSHIPSTRLISFCEIIFHSFFLLQDNLPSHLSFPRPDTCLSAPSSSISSHSDDSSFWKTISQLSPLLLVLLQRQKMFFHSFLLPFSSIFFLLCFMLHFLLKNNLFSFLLLFVLLPSVSCPFLEPSLV